MPGGKNNMKKGFTLIELTIYIGIVALMSTAIVGMYINISQLKLKTQVWQEVNDSLRLVSTRLNQEIKMAKSINSLTASTLSLQFADSTRNPTTFDLTSGVIRMGVGTTGVCSAASPCPITSNTVNITGFTLTNLSSGDSKTINIRYNIAGQYKITNGVSQSSYSNSIQGSSEVRSK